MSRRNYDMSVFERRADLPDIYPGAVLWLVQAGQIHKVTITSPVYLVTYPHNHYCVQMKTEGRFHRDMHCSDIGLRKSSAGNCLFVDRSDAEQYVNGRVCSVCGK